MGIEFKNLEAEDIIALLPRFRRQNLRLAVYSAVYKIMWDNHFKLKFAETQDCVVFMERFRGVDWFHYPMSQGDEEAEARAVRAVEEYCRQNAVRLHWSNVPQSRLWRLVERYGADVTVKSYLRWRDYLYNASDFRDYPGGKFSGQRNHANKFRKLYPDYKFEKLSGADEEEIREFLKEYRGKQLKKGTAMAKAEMEAAFKILPYIDKLEMKAGAIKINGKIAALAMGAVCGDTLMVDVEKALDYEGVYQTMAQEFARAFTGGAVQYINREDDAGDRGLRKSKLQYNPVARLDKYNLIPMRPIDGMSEIPHIKTERLEIGEFTEGCKEELFRLETDLESNKYWGYDWRKDYSGEGLPAADYFLECKRQIFARREEAPMGVYLDGKLIGETVLHNFGYDRECEVGIRLLPEYRGAGYAREAVAAAADFAFIGLDMDKVVAKCFKANGESRRCLIAAGLRECGCDDTYFYFYKTPKT